MRPGKNAACHYEKAETLRFLLRAQKSMLIRLPLPQCFCPRGRKLRPWSEENSDQNSDHSRLCIYWGKEKLRPWSEFLGRENSDHGLSFGCFWGRGRRGGSQKNAALFWRFFLRSSVDFSAIFCRRTLRFCALRFENAAICLRWRLFWGP